MFTGYADIKAVIDAINQGQIFRYLTKPWDPDELVAALRQGCEEYDRLTARRRPAPRRPGLCESVSEAARRRHAAAYRRGSP